MIILKRMTVLLTVVLSITVGIVVVVARQQSLPDAMSVLHFEMCAPPCWIGIEPGTTTLDRAIIRARQVYRKLGHTVSLRQIGLGKFHLTIENGTPQFPGSVYFRTNRGQTISRIEFDFTQNVSSRVFDNYSFLDAYRSFGAPAQVSFWLPSMNNANAPYLVYDNGAVAIFGDLEIGNNLLERRVYSITFPSLIYDPSRQIGWRGFGSISRYYTQWVSVNP
jgi:hypothetical protein